MSVITLEDYITCLNKDESPESIFKRLIAVSSSGTLYFRTDASIYLALSKYTLTFTDADLVDVVIDAISHRVLLVNHGFGTQSYDYIVRDNNGNGVVASESVIDNDSTYIIIDSVITGTWSIYMFVI